MQHPALDLPNTQLLHLHLLLHVALHSLVCNLSGVLDEATNVQAQDPESAAAKILAVEPTLKVNFSRANGALHRAPNDKVHPGTSSATMLRTLVEACRHCWLLVIMCLA